MADIGVVIEELQLAGKAAADLAVEEHRGALGSVHQLDHDLSSWLDLISGPEATQLQAARRELAIGEYAAASGMYRAAFASLRLFLELSFAGVHFSANEFDRRRWMSDRADFSWSRALDPDEGVLSKKFVDEFAPDLQANAKVFALSAAETYRYCSQFIHGKAATSSVLPDALVYKGEVVESWCSHAIRSGEAVLFLLYIRYGTELQVDSDQSVSEMLISRFSHMPAVRSRLGLADA